MILSQSLSTFSENYEFISQNEIHSAHWEHQSCTLFTAMVHYIELKQIFVSDYLNHDKYAVVAIYLSELLNDFKFRYSSIQFENITLQSDGTAQYFKDIH